MHIVAPRRSVTCRVVLTWRHVCHHVSTTRHVRTPKPEPNRVSNNQNPNPTGFQTTKTRTQPGFKQSKPEPNRVSKKQNPPGFRSTQFWPVPWVGFESQFCGWKRNLGRWGVDYDGSATRHGQCGGARLTPGWHLIRSTLHTRPNAATPRHCPGMRS